MLTSLRSFEYAGVEEILVMFRPLAASAFVNETEQEEKVSENGADRALFDGGVREPERGYVRQELGDIGVGGLSLVEEGLFLGGLEAFANPAGSPGQSG